MIIYHHLGLGDHIICNGLVRSLADKHQNITLLCKHNNFKNIQFMYRDSLNINVMPVRDDAEADAICRSGHCIRCGSAISAKIYPVEKKWDEVFYYHANIPFDYSWQKFCYKPDTECEKNLFDILVNNEDYIFIHNKDSGGTDRINWDIIDKSKKIITTQPDIPFFAYGEIINKAKEIHCINSSFIHLIDRISTKGHLFYHKLHNPNPYSDFTQKKQWIIV